MQHFHVRGDEVEFEYDTRFKMPFLVKVISFITYIHLSQLKRVFSESGVWPKYMLWEILAKH